MKKDVIGSYTELHFAAWHIDISTNSTSLVILTVVPMCNINRCDVAVDDIKPAHCSRFRKFDGLQTIKDHLTLAVNKIDRGFDFVIVSNAVRELYW